MLTTLAMQTFVTTLQMIITSADLEPKRERGKSVIVVPYEQERKRWATPAPLRSQRKRTMSHAFCTHDALEYAGMPPCQGPSQRYSHAHRRGEHKIYPFEQRV
ncbi:hypothetical protein BaRGS_00032121 [Batillaria attramentaria]